jgi:hypothetical protein
MWTHFVRSQREETVKKSNLLALSSDMPFVARAGGFPKHAKAWKSPSSAFSSSLSPCLS